MIQNNTHISFVWTFFWDFTNVCADCLSFSLAHLYPAGPSPSPPDTLPTTFTYWIVEGPNKKKKNTRHTLLNYTKRSTTRASNYTKELRSSSGELLQSLALIWIIKSCIHNAKQAERMDSACVFTVINTLCSRGSSGFEPAYHSESISRNKYIWWRLLPISARNDFEISLRSEIVPLIHRLLYSGLDTGLCLPFHYQSSLQIWCSRVTY